jgi:hypothetical protein
MSFRPMDKNTDYLLPPSVQEWLPQAHLARYVVEVVDGLDLSALERAYAGKGSEAYQAKVTARKQKAATSGKKPDRKPPTPPTAGPRPDDQVNLTDDDSRIMKTGQDFEQSDNAQATGDAESMLILVTYFTQAANNKE